MTRSWLIILGLAAVGCGLLAGAPSAKRAPRVLFNTTASAPLGFYRVDQGWPRLGDLIVVRPPVGLSRWMAMRGYLPRNVPLLKRLAAGEGQRVCGLDGRVLIDGRGVVRVLTTDHLGRRLTPFAGCRRLGPDEIFLLNPDAPGSLDGRYFGPLSRRTVVGRATPIWTWGAS